MSMEVMHRYLTESQQSLLLVTLKLLASTLARRDRAWINLLKNTGMRIGEFSRLTVRQARQALETGWLFIPKEHRKGKRADHSVAITDPVREDLKALLAIQREMGGAGADDEPLIYSRKGGRMSVRAYQERFTYWCRRCGFTASPHWMRHTRAMNIMRRSTSTDPRGAVQSALGHISISSTGVYTRMSKEELLRVLDEVDGKRRSPKKKLREIYEGRAA
jgi:site-specific recombinase XerC